MVKEFDLYETKDDDGRGRVGPDGSVTPRYITEESLVTSVWYLRNQPGDISCFQRDRVFGPYGGARVFPSLFYQRGTEGTVGTRKGVNDLPAKIGWEHPWNTWNTKHARREATVQRSSLAGTLC